MNYSLLTLLLLFSSLMSVWAQPAGKIKRQAEQYFEEGQYDKSLTEYYKIKEKYKEDATVCYNMGVALFETRAYSKSIQQLQQHLDQTRRPEPMAAYYLARANHLQDSFLIAAHYYKRYLRNLEEDAPQRPIFKRLILQCTNGLKVQQINSRAIITRLGQEINSPQDDYRICFNPLHPNSIFFSSKRPLSSPKTETNLYRADQEQGTFLAAQPLQKRYNTPLSETLLAFFDKGYQLLLLKELSNGQTGVFKDNFDADSIEVLLPFATPLSSTAWDSEHFFVNDSMVIFASNRSGGFGGSDLYYATRKSGTWQLPINLGSMVNGPNDETGPFLAKDGLHLYFNSNRAEGMGGHDIYQATFDLAQQRFLEAQNMGVPLNSSADDKDFILYDDGNKGYLSSNRIGSLGGLDLYAVYFRTPVIAQTTNTLTSFIEQLEQNAATTTANADSVPRPILPNPNPIATNERYTLGPIYYDASTGQLNGSRNTLINLEKLLLKYPQLRIILSAHSNSESDPSTDLYLTVKQAEVVAKSLLDKGVRNQQLFLRGCSQNYPLASSKNFDGSKNPLAKTINQRINITLYGQNQLPPQVAVDLVEPEINAVMQSQAAANYHKKLKGLSYKVKLTESPTIFQHVVLQQYQDITTEKRPNDNYVTYLVGLEKNFIDIKYAYNQLIDKGFSKVEIVAYIDGWPITEAEAQVLFADYPDLKVFLDYRASAN